ncbi:MAG: hypothetical protein ACREJ3_18435, partial [Polyangiaceae bacterium]
FKGGGGGTDASSLTVLAGEKALARFARVATSAEQAPPGEATSPLPSGEGPRPGPSATASSPPVGITPSSVRHGAGLFAPPENMVPVVLGGVVTLLGVGVAIGMLAAKGSAQDKADSTAANIKSQGGTSCVPPTPGSLPGLADACSAFLSDNSDVNTDALIGNVALGVGVLAFAGTLIYYFVADKGVAESSPSQAALHAPTIVPWVSRTQGGLSLGTSF